MRPGYFDLLTVVTMDLATGRVVELRSTGSDATADPGLVA